MDAKHLVSASIAALGLVQLSPSLPLHLARADAAEVPVTKRATPPPRAPGDPVVLLVVDGVRWQEIFRGVDPALAAGTHAGPLDAEHLTPHLHTIVRERGAALGAPGRSAMSASGPRFVSLPSYREIFSGEASLDCLDNECTPIERRTFVDQLRDGGGRAAVFSSWKPIERAVAKDVRGIVLSNGRDATDDATDPYPGDGAFRPDRFTAAAALTHLETERPDFLFLGLGEPDEYAHRGDYPGYLDAIRAADGVVGQLLETLERMGPRGRRTHVFVTTDHGRAASFREHGGAYPESAAVWAVAWGPSIRARGALVTREAHHLRDLAPTARVIAGLLPGPQESESGSVLEDLLLRGGGDAPADRGGDPGGPPAKP